MNMTRIVLPRSFSLHHRCYWCEFPLSDCVCPISRLKTSSVNDNEEPKARKG